ncbi:hypothetical protein [Oceanicoccus sagamiensis]|uniref:Uncharacterized protein n=1 Tax=Oceanicoccus sagamiensis TaxID=716816 RepID=A0A1X9NBA0_9GAMM|nr:hypothetical protein [Oceanicoccus sagamiensis]ARN73195.1 hypothetical protein BST96_03185 [Oceanicoccus sagamiensis]
MKKLLSALALCSLASFAQAGCLDWKDQPPTIPAGDTATIEQMFKAQEEVKFYVNEGMEELECATNNFKYNHIVYRLKKLADNYNQELHSFKHKVAQR